MSTDKQTIEQAYTELQQIVKEFERDEVDLEKSIPKFKRGLELAAKLKEKLTQLKNEVEEIKAKFEDEIVEEPTAEESEDSASNNPEPLPF